MIVRGYSGNWGNFFLGGSGYRNDGEYREDGETHASGTIERPGKIVWSGVRCRQKGEGLVKNSEIK